MQNALVKLMRKKGVVNRLALATVLQVTVLLLLILPNSPKAETVCEQIGRSLFRIAITAQGLSLAVTDNQASYYDARLNSAIDELSKQQKNHPDIKKRTSTIAIFVMSRRLLSKIYRDKGIQAAKAYYFTRVSRPTSSSLANELEKSGCIFDAGNMSLERVYAIEEVDGLKNKRFSSYILVGKSDNEKRKGFFSRKSSIEDYANIENNYVLFPFMGLIIGLLFVAKYLEERKGQRFDIYYHAVALIDGTVNDVIIQNISSNGARISTSYELDVGEKFLLVIENYTVLSEVMWVGKRSYGIKFCEKLKKKKINEIIRAGS